MNAHRFAWMISLLTLGACAGGQTLRVAADPDTSSTPTAVALTPEGGSDTTAQPAQAPAAAEEPNAAPAQGYAPYGETAGESRDLEVRRIGQWAHTSIAEPRRMVIRDANGFAQLWSELGAGERPDVDFTQNVVVVAASGERPTGGYGIAIDRVSQADGQLTIQVVETTPGPNCVTSGAATRPVDVVAVPAAAVRGWSFLERKEIRSCR